MLPGRRETGHVKVFKFYWQFFKTSIEAGGASDADIKTVLEFLKQRNFAMAIEAGLVADKNQGKIEGYDGTATEEIIARIKRLGGDLRYVAMDEPFWFGHQVTRKQDPYAMEASIPDLAKNVAVQVSMIHRYFPNAQVGDIEPVVNPGRGDYDVQYPERIIEWANAFKAATGQPLAFFMSDFAWGPDGKAPEPFADLSRLLKQNGIPVGVIYDAGAGMTSGEQWTTDAEKHFVNVESDPSLIPDIALIQSWDAQPDHTLPETKPGTMTYLLDRYLTAPTELKVKKTRDGFEGTLLSRGTPVSGTPVTAEESDDGNQNILWTSTNSGKVPAKAVKARIVLRVNVEPAGSDKTVDIQLGETRYSDKKSKFTFAHRLGPARRRLQVPAGQKTMTDSEPFDVTGRGSLLLLRPDAGPLLISKSGLCRSPLPGQAGEGDHSCSCLVHTGRARLLVGHDRFRWQLQNPAAGFRKTAVDRPIRLCRRRRSSAQFHLPALNAASMSQTRRLSIPSIRGQVKIAQTAVSQAAKEASLSA